MGLKRLPRTPSEVLHGARNLLRRLPKTFKGAISAQDIAEVAKLAGQGVLAWSLPESAWWPASRLMGRLEVATHPKRTHRETADVAALITGMHATSDPLRIVGENWANRYGERFQYLRAWRPGGWNPRIDVVGGAHVSAALDRGRGIIFWGGNFSFNNLVAKMAMRSLGLAVVGFSVPRHGFSKTAFGVRYLNRLYRDIEDRYLQERLMTAPDAHSAALQRMRDCLKVNGAVYFTVGGRGRRTATAKFLGDRIILATAPLAMAHTMGAAMLSILRRHGFSVPEGIAFHRDAISEACGYFSALLATAPHGVCVKPTAGRRGRKVYLGVRDLPSFRSAFRSVTKGFDQVLIEEVVAGKVYRFFCLAGRVIAIRHGVPANVEGDGMHSIAELLDIKNRERARTPPLDAISVTGPGLRLVEEQGMSLTSIPKVGEIVWLSRMSNLDQGADIVDATGSLHPSYNALVEQAVQKFPGLVLCGADVAIEDASVPATQVNYHFIELNDSPGFHHYPAKDAPRDLAGAIVDYLMTRG